MQSVTSETNNHGAEPLPSPPFRGEKKIFGDRDEYDKAELFGVPQTQTPSPSINYGRIIVRNTRQGMHGGIYDERRYYVEVINKTPNTVARNCKGSLDTPTEEVRDHSMIWENGSETIDIGHNGLLYLFEVAIFNKYSERTLTLLHFHGQQRIVDSTAEKSYNNKLDKILRVLIQSENARFPSESESLRKTIREIINEAVQA
jgi:hypothetical protein